MYEFFLFFAGTSFPRYAFVFSFMFVRSFFFATIFFVQPKDYSKLERAHICQSSKAVRASRGIPSSEHLQVEWAAEAMRVS